MAADRKGFSMQLDAELLERIDRNALLHAGGNRTQYILSWLPETYDRPTADSQPQQDEDQPSER